MAEKNVIRQDIIQIGWDVEPSPLNDIAKETQKFQKAFDKFGGNQDKLKAFSKEMGKLNAQRLSGLSKSVDEVAKKIGGGLVSVSKKAALTVAAIGTAGVTGFAAIAKSAVAGYGDYEQLVGGVETLFKDSKDTVVKYANDAYKTAGLSANAYMETVTSFSASLLKSVGGDTAVAAKQANVALVDMSDNANKMGTDMASIQNAYQGFAKQNYTMLDNLKLGYGGTKEEMQRLLKDAQKISGQKYNLSSFNDIVQAIHVVQEEMGIAGTTSKEASTTIQGSINSMKSAYANFVAGMADPSQDFDQLTSNLVDSVVTVAKNIIPRIKATIPRLAKGLGEIAQELFAAAVANVKDLGPIGSALQTIGDKVKSFVSNTEKMQIVKDIFSSIKSAVENIAPILGNVVAGVWDFVTSTGLLNGVKIIFDGINKAIGWVKDNFAAIKEVVIAVGSAFLIFGAAVKVVSIAVGAYNAIMKVVKTVQLIAAASQLGFNAALLACPVSWIVGAIVGLIAIVVLLARNWDKVKEVGANCWNKLKEVWGAVGGWFNSNVVQPVKQFFVDLWNKLPEPVQGVLSSIKGAFSDAFESVKKVWSGITGFFSNLWDGIKGIVGKIIGKGNEAKGAADSAKSTRFARGGLVTRPTKGLVGEAGAEMIIPLTKKSRGLELWEQAGRMLGATPTVSPQVALPKYSPSSSVSNVSNSSSATNNYSPQFTLNLSGTVDRTTQRVIKQWVMDALKEVFDSMERSNPRVTEV